MTVAAGASGKILFVVPTEPLVWQVAALFNKLLRGQVRVIFVTAETAKKKMPMSCWLFAWAREREPIE